MGTQLPCHHLSMGIAVAVLLISGLAGPAHASIAYGSLNNFDTVNDTGVPCHGFEIEIEDIHSTDITYTYDWSHYGVPRITEDNANSQHPRVYVRYESPKNQDGSWAAYTAVPDGPIAPTDGHQFTDPSVNFGGEHFGVGFYGFPAAVRYFWLIDDGMGNLIRGGEVYISTPEFAYFPPGNGAPARVQAAIAAPRAPEVNILEFGPAVWVKEIRTESHNNHRVELRDLVTDDPDDPDDRNWANGEPDEVEVEWQLLQTEFNTDDGGGNGELAAEPEDLPDGDEIITRRYEFYKYVGPLDPETGEAKAAKVGPDDIHGVRDYADVVIVGDYIGAQMAGFDPEGQLGLIDHLQDGEMSVPYTDRTIVIGGIPPVITTLSGPLPEGMYFDEISGVLSGTPTEGGTFTFTVQSNDMNGGDVSKTYHLTIIDEGIEEPLHVTITTETSPSEGGTTTGDDEYVIGTEVSVSAFPNPGYDFLSWTEGGTTVSVMPLYQFIADVNRKLTANFTLAGEGEGETEGELNNDPISADTNADHLIDLSELLRVIQFYNSAGFHCDAGSEDGFAPGPGDHMCNPYKSDYNPQDWSINLSELLRIIQFYNSGGYHACKGSEDGYCAGII